VLGLNQDGDILFVASLGRYVWPYDGDPILLGHLGGFVSGLSDRDAAGVVQFAAASGTPGVSGTRILYQIGADPSTITYQAIGSIGANWSDPFAIGGSGHIVGEGLVSTKRTTQVAHAYVQTGDASTIKDIGTLGGEDSWATAVNRGGDIIGMAETAQSIGLGDQYDSRFIRTGGLTPKMYDLEKMIDGPLPSELRYISQIGDSKIICGPNEGPAGTQAFVLIPYTP
jgi:hypothetical protein